MVGLYCLYTKGSANSNTAHTYSIWYPLIIFYRMCGQNTIHFLQIIWIKQRNIWRKWTDKDKRCIKISCSCIDKLRNF